MMPPKFYTWNELQAMSSDVPPRDIVRKFLSPGMTYEDVAPTHPYRSQILAPKLTNDIRSEEYRLRPRERANLYNALADYQSLYGIPVKVKTYPAVNPCDHVSIPRALEDAIIQLGSATNPDCPRYEIIPVLGYPLAVKGMLSHWKQTVPSPNESRYLWDVFKMAFISRGSRYCSIAIGITPQDMMRRFEMLYDELTEGDQLPGTRPQGTLREMAELFSK